VQLSNELRAGKHCQMTTATAGRRKSTQSRHHSLLGEQLIEPMHVELLTSEDTFDRLQSIWQALEKADPDCQPFNTWSWLSLWWQHYRKDGDSLAILIVRQGRKVVAIAPFYVGYVPELRYMRISLLRFIGTGGDTSPDYMNIIALPQWRVAAEQAIIGHLPQVPGWHKLLLRDVSKGSTLALCIQTFIESQAGFAWPIKQNLILRARLPESWDAYKAQLSRKRRKQINHRRNRLDAAGDWALSICSSEIELQEAVEALKKLHRQRWNSKGKAGRFASQNYIQFHSAVIKRFFADHCLWLATLRLDNEIIGVQYIFLWRGELLFYQSGYSPEHDCLSPGHVLFTYTIQRAIEQGLTGIDMLKGDYVYKSAYAKSEFYTSDHVFVKRGIFSLLARAKVGVRALGNQFIKT